jgi:hypothetical protein
MNAIGPGLIAIVGGVITLAMIAVVVSKNAQSSAVLTGAGTALSSVIGAAVAPVSNSTGSTLGSSSTGATGAIV